MGMLQTDVQYPDVASVLKCQRDIEERDSLTKGWNYVPFCKKKHLKTKEIS